MGIIEFRNKADVLISQMRTHRETYRPHWLEIKENMLPEHGHNLHGDDYQTNTDGGKKRQRIYDDTPEDAIDIMAAGMQSGMTSPARPWYKLGIDDLELNESHSVRSYLDEVTRRMNAVFAKSNIYDVFPNMYKELGGFGTAAMGVFESLRTIIRARTFTAGEWMGAQDYEFRVNTFFREIDYTVAQLVEEFGLENVTEKVKDAWNNGNKLSIFRVNSLILPNTPDLDLPQKMKTRFVSVYWEKGSQSDKVLRITGFHEFPFMTPRWNRTGVNFWGSGPGQKMLPSVKMLHEMQKKTLIALAKVIEPPVMAPGSLKTDVINSMPGGITYSDDLGDGQRSGLRPLYEIRPDIQSMEAKIERVQLAVRRGFFNDLFLMLANIPTNNMTATEVAERHEEKLIMLGPVLEKVHHEMLDPVIDRTFAIMERAGALPEPPEELQGREIKVEYISILAQAQKLAGANALQQFSGFAGNLAGVWPEVLDNVDPDAVIREYADVTGVPAIILRNEEDVAALREIKAQRAQQQEAMAAAQSGAQTAKLLSEANTGTNSALDAIMQTPPGTQ